MERAEQSIGPADVLALATVYGIGEQERDRYVALALQSRQKNCPFSLVSFPDPEDHDVACVDYLAGAVYVEEPEDVEGFILAFDGLKQALGIDESTELVRGLPEAG